MRSFWKYFLLFGSIVCACSRVDGDIPPFTPSILSVEASATSNSILLKTQVNNRDGISEYGFYYGTGSSSTRISASNMDDCRFSCRIQDLEPGTQYHYKAFISNGLSEITSAEQSISTLREPAPTDIINIPDPTLNNYLIWHYDTNGDGFLSQEEALAIIDIGITSDELASLEGIENLRNLERLTANGEARSEGFPSKGGLTGIDLSGNPKLTELSLDYQNIKEIDLSANTKLKEFGMFKNPIKKLDLSLNEDLVLFGAGFCQLDSIDLSNNGKLDEVHLDCNKLQKIELGINHTLRYLDVTGNLLKRIDLSGCDHLREFHCTNNPQLDTVFIKTGQAFDIFEIDKSVTIVTKD